MVLAPANPAALVVDLASGSGLNPRPHALAVSMLRSTVVWRVVAWSRSSKMARSGGLPAPVVAGSRSGSTPLRVVNRPPRVVSCGREFYDASPMMIHVKVPTRKSTLRGVQISPRIRARLNGSVEGSSSFLTRPAPDHERRPVDRQLSCTAVR